MFYISQNIRCREIEPFQFASSIKILTLENKSRKRKLLIFGTYKPTNISNRSLLNELCNAINFYDTLYKNCVLLGDLNIVRDNTELQNFGESFLFQHFIKKTIDDFEVSVDNLARECKLWSNLYKMASSSLRCWITALKKL